MNAADYARLVDSVRVRIPSVLDGTIKLELFATLKEFAERADCWRETIAFTAQPDTSDYVLLPLSGGLVNRLMWVTTVDQPNMAIPAAMGVVGTVTLTNSVFTATPMLATVSLTVDDPTDSQGFPTFDLSLLKRYHNGILDGLLSRLMSQMSKPYSSEKGAVFHGRRFTSAVNLAKRDTRAGNKFAGAAWNFPKTMT